MRTESKGGVLLDNLGAWLREQRLAHGWSAAEMGRRLQQAAKASGDNTLPGAAILAAYVRRWENGLTAPTERYRLLYCRALGITPAEFSPRPAQKQRAASKLADIESGTIPAAGAQVGTAPGGPGGYRDGGEGQNATEMTEQPAVAAISPERLMAMIAEESLDLGEWVGMSEVADTAIEQYADQAQRLAKVFEYAVSLPLLLETRQLRDRVAAQLRGHQRLAQARDLYLIGAQVCGLLAWMTGDLGNYRAADTHAWTAWLCAEQAGHDGARAWVRATQAKLAYWDGRYSESARLAEEGLSYASTDSAPVFLALFCARAMARTGRRGEAARVLATVTAKREEISAPDLLGGIWELTPARYHGLIAGVRLLMDEPGEAIAEASRSITLSEAVPPGDRHLYAEFLVRTDQAQAYLQRSDLDGAVATLRPVLSLAADMRTEPIVQHLTRLRPSLALPRFAATALAQELQEEIEAYNREALPRQLSA